MKTNDIRNMTTEELKAKLITLKTESFNLRFQHATGSLGNPLMLNTVKKDIAKIKTILTERELKINQPKDAPAVASKAKAKAKA
jgi:large subunit ribosomal protein L29